MSVRVHLVWWCITKKTKDKAKQMDSPVRIVVCPWLPCSERKGSRKEIGAGKVTRASLELCPGPGNVKQYIPLAGAQQ